MAETLGQGVRIRLKPSSKERYEAEAAAHNKDLGTYLRERLESQDEVLDQLATIRYDLAELADEVHRASRTVQENPRKKAQPHQHQADGMMVEILLLLRALSPGKTTMVQKEVERAGLTVWSGD